MKMKEVRKSFNKKHKIIFCVIVIGLSLTTLLPVYQVYKRERNTFHAYMVMYDVHELEKFYAEKQGKGNFTTDPNKVFPPCRKYQKYCGPIEEPEEARKLRLLGKYPGYQLVVTITPKTERSEASFTAFIYPEVSSGFFRTGNNCFRIDQTGVLSSFVAPCSMYVSNNK